MLGLPQISTVSAGTPATPGRTGTTDVDPAEAARSAFEANEQMIQTMDAYEPKIAGVRDALALLGVPLLKVAARKLHGRRKFRGLDVSIENRKGSFRHWYDPHTDEHGSTEMLFPYGYIRGTLGMDGDHLDVFLGPNEDAPNVYVILTNKAPDFKDVDEEKCFLGFDSEDAAKAAFRKHYDKPGFFNRIKTLSFEAFKTRIFDESRKGKKVANVRTSAMPDLDLTNGREPLGTSTTPCFAPPSGVEEKSLGYPNTGATRWIIGDPMRPTERAHRAFHFFDQPMDTHAIEEAHPGAPMDW